MPKGVALRLSFSLEKRHIITGNDGNRAVRRSRSDAAPPTAVAGARFYPQCSAVIFPEKAFARIFQVAGLMLIFGNVFTEPAEAADHATAEVDAAVEHNLLAQGFREKPWAFIFAPTWLGLSIAMTVVVALMCARLKLVLLEEERGAATPGARLSAATNAGSPTTSTARKRSYSMVVVKVVGAMVVLAFYMALHTVVPQADFGVAEIFGGVAVPLMYMSTYLEAHFAGTGRGNAYPSIKAKNIACAYLIVLGISGLLSPFPAASGVVFAVLLAAGGFVAEKFTLVSEVRVTAKAAAADPVPPSGLKSDAQVYPVTAVAVGEAPAAGAAGAAHSAESKESDTSDFGKRTTTSAALSGASVI